MYRMRILLLMVKNIWVNAAFDLFAKLDDDGCEKPNVGFQ